MSEARPQAGAVLSLAELRARAASLWRELPAGSVVWLTGEIGTGKTTLVRALTEAAQAAPARSPTFSLVHEYPSPDGLIIHADCYRLRDPREAIDLDFPELERRARLLLVEWPERAGPYAPPHDAHIHLSHAESAKLRVLERIR